MAKDEKTILTPEEKKLEKELLEKDKKEKAEIDRMQKEKLKKKQHKIKKAKAEVKVETKRINKLVNLPFKLLLQVSLLATMFASIFLFFWLELDLKTSLLYTFLIFSLFYLGLGSIMIAVFFMIGEDKKRELEESKRLNEEKKQGEEKQRQLDEEAKLSEIEREIAEKKTNSIRSKELTANQIDDELMGDPFATELVSDPVNPFMLEDSSPTLDYDFNENFDSMLSNDLEKEFANSAQLSKDEETDDSDEDSGFNELSYFDEIMSPEFNQNKNKN